MMPFRARAAVIASLLGLAACNNQAQLDRNHAAIDAALRVADAAAAGRPTAKVAPTLIRPDEQRHADAALQVAPSKPAQVADRRAK